jgi:hypothetical protein
MSTQVKSTPSYAFVTWLLSPDACAFVLTLKFCNAGHGRGRYDEYAEVKARRSRVAGAYGVKVLHLFSNRLSERTLVGFMK